MVVLGRLTPIDPRYGIPLLVLSELPKGFTLAYAATAMHALGYGGGDPICRNQKGREARSRFLGSLPNG
jgi:hypothetical protein